MPTRSPYETFNVFDKDIQKELTERRTSTNLLEVRTPFLRYTTTVEFPTREWYDTLAKESGAQDTINYLEPFNLNRYSGCKFFTLGLHGWDNESYTDADIYGTRADNGLVVGVTYSQGEQKLVRTNNETTKNVGERFQSPQGYPPPGIESATVERLRNGNVLKFTINAVCYTQQQLEMLEMLAFSPGMTCILEWGNIISTPTGQKGLNKDRILNFKNVRDTEIVLNFWLGMFTGGLRRRGMSQGARSLFIDSFCKPNNYHYDFSIARIANVKTSIEDNKYKVSVIAYGVADNIMYISAYATNNPDFQQDSNSSNDQVILKSVREYFAPRSKFTYLLDALVDTDAEIVKFDEPDDADYKQGPGAAAGSKTATNDLGQEQTFYITLNRFINFFLNDRKEGLASIINNSINITDSVDSKNNSNFGLEILEDLKDIENNPIKVGYNEVLRSTDPSTVLIVNPKAMRGVSSTKLSNFRSNLKLTDAGQNRTATALTKLTANQLKKVDEAGNVYFDGRPSGIATSTSGIWLNSRLIQAVFLEARTIHEGIESLLNKINAATEGYWNLTLTYDEELSNFRIVDNNLKISPKNPQGIYTFNKRLPNNTASDDSVVGSEILDIKINADYPKLLVSQLGISAINNSSGVPDRKDLQYARNPLMGPRLPDALRKEQPTKPKETITPCSVGTSLNKFVEVALKSTLYKDTKLSIQESLRLAGFDSFSDNIRNALNDIFLIQRPLTKTQAQSFATLIAAENLTDNQIKFLKNALISRSESIIIRAKNKEEALIRSDVRKALNIRASSNGVSINKEMDDITKNIQKSKEELLQLFSTKREVVTGPPSTTQPAMGSATPTARTPSQNVVGGIGR